MALFGVLAACGGGGSSSGSVPPVTNSGPTPRPTATATPTPMPTQTPQSTGTAQLQLTIPSVGPSLAHRSSSVARATRNPLFVSINTGTVAVWINGASVDPSTIKSVCNPADPSGEICTISIPAPAGNDTFRVELADSNLDVLSEGTTQAVIYAGQVTLLHVTYLGVPAWATLTLDNASPEVGQSSTVHLTAVAYDASGAQINGDNYFTPVSVAQDDKTGQVSLGGSQFAKPGDSIAVNYGGKLIPNVTFRVVSPSSSRDVAAVLSPTPYQSFPVTYGATHVVLGADGNIWFTECTGNIGPCKIGKMTPSGQLTESADVRWAQALTLGPDGNIWFTENNFPYIAKITPSMQITEYQTKTLAANEAYYGGPIVVGPDRNLWFMELGDLAEASASGQILNRIPVSGADWSPSMVVGADGNFWIAGLGQIVRVTPSGTVNNFFFGSLSGILQSNLLLAPDNDIYFYFDEFYKIATDGTVTTVTTTPSTLRFQGGFSIGPDKNVWGLVSSTDPYNPVGGAASMNMATGALTVYEGAAGGGAFSAVWDNENDLWLPNGGSLTRFKYDLP